MENRSTKVQTHSQDTARERRITELGSRSTASTKSSSNVVNGTSVNKWIELGNYFRESMLKEGTVMPMRDIRDKMPKSPGL